MGLASALTTALTGLTAAETQIDVVGNNLANAQTVGFKESEVAFTTQFLQTLSLGSAPTGDLGGTNPRQTGLGTKVAEISPKFTQGTIQSSAVPTDVALQGDGFFIVAASTGEQFYTRTGIFKTNADNELVTVNGNRVLGYAVDDEFQLTTNVLSPIQVPVGDVRVAQETENVYLEGVLPPNGDLADAAEVIDSAILGTGSVPQADASSSSIQTATAPNSGAVGTTQADGGGALDENATYRYRFAFADNVGTESTVSDDLSVPIAAGNGFNDNSVTLQNLPTSVGNYDTLNVYRTAADGSDYYLLDSVDVSGGGSINYVDDGSRALDTTTPLDQGMINGNYSYMVTYARSGAEESRPSELIGPINVVNGRIQLQDLPTPPVPGPGDTFPAYDRIRLYRNLSTDANSFHFVTELTPGEDYTDNVGDSVISANQQLDLDGPRVNNNTLLTDVIRRDGTNYEQLFEEGTLRFTGRKGGRQMSTQELEITSTSTMQDLMDFISDSNGIQPPSNDPTNPIATSVNEIPGDTGTLTPGASITSDGRVRVVANNGVDNAVDIGLSSFVLTTNAGEISVPNMTFDQAQEARGESAVGDFLVYDSLGVPINVRVTAVMEARDGQATTYRWFADSPDNDPNTGIEITGGTGLVTFDGEGNFVSSTNTEVGIDRRNSPAFSPLAFDLDFSGMSGLSADNATLAAARQDGSGAGTLASFNVGEDGIIRGAFSNGSVRTLGQIRLAKFANPAGLEQKGENMFATGINSGSPVEGNPGENGIATIVAGAVELSNTDIGGNLIDLVLATNHYRGNTRVISTAQQLLDELLNIRR